MPRPSLCSKKKTSAPPPSPEHTHTQARGDWPTTDRYLFDMFIVDGSHLPQNMCNVHDNCNHKCYSFSMFIDLPASFLLEAFGKMFFKFCQDAGYDKILKVLGGTPRDFLQNLDALHDHLATIYPGMQAPSFRCSYDENNQLILHYYSERPGLEHIVIGIVKEVADKLHNSEVEVKVIKTKAECDHVQFAIIEKDRTKQIGPVVSENIEDMNLAPMISPATFCRAFPFHIVFDRHMVIQQIGSSLLRVIPQVVRTACRIDDILEMVRPHMDFSFEHIMAHINTVYVLRTKEGILTNSVQEDTVTKFDHHDTSRMRLKGQMVYVSESDCLLFMCSPSVSSLDDLNHRGLYLSDIPIHDSTRELVLLSEKFEEEYRLAQRLEFLTEKLKRTHRELEDEKRKTDRYTYYIVSSFIVIYLYPFKYVLAMCYTTDVSKMHNNRTQHILFLQWHSISLKSQILTH